MPLPGMFGIGGGLVAAGATAVSTYTSSGSINPGSGTTHTVPGMALGTASSGRYLVALVGGSSGTSGQVSSVTINGVSASLLARTTGSESKAGIYIAAVPTGTTGSTVVTYTASTLATGVALYLVTGLISTALINTASNNTNSTATINLNIGYYAGDLVFGVAISGGVANNSWTWTGLTENVETDIRADDKFSAASGATGTISSTLTGTSINSAARVVVSIR